MKLPTFKVKQGIIHVNSIDIMHCSKNALVFSIDCQQKRPDYKGCEQGGSFTFHLGSDEETLHVNEPNAPDTEIEVLDWGGTGDFWTFVEAGKWGMRCAITKIECVGQFIDDDGFTNGGLG